MSTVEKSPMTRQPLIVGILSFLAAFAPVTVGAWLLRAEGLQSSGPSDSTFRRPWVILACGVPLAVVIATAAARQARRQQELEVRIIERSQQLRAAHDRLQELLTRERELNAMKTNFISMVTHELRTPLSVVQSSTDILARYRDRLSAESQMEQLQAITQAVSRITGLSEEVLLFSRFEAQQMQLKPCEMILESFCQAVIRELRSAHNNKCPITLECAPDLPAALADERLLRHIIVNLLGNAVKYSQPDAPVTLRVSREGELAVFVVCDEGIGIPKDEQCHLFESFYRGSKTEHIPGTGLGLVIVSRCVELQGGTVSLQSEEGRGTQVTVALPLFAPTVKESKSEFAASSRGDTNLPA